MMLSAQEVGTQLGLSARKIYNLFHEGKLAGFRFDDSIRFEQVDVDAYKASCRKAPPEAIHVHRPVQPTLKVSRPSGSLAQFFKDVGVTPRLDPPSSRPKTKQRARQAQQPTSGPERRRGD